MGDEGELVEIAGRRFRLVDVDNCAARRLIDLHSILNDLHRVVTRCELMDDPNMSNDVRDAVWESVVIAYGRCFTAGRSLKGLDRRRIPNHAVESLGQTSVETHELLMRERNRNVAHRDDQVGEFGVVTRFQERELNGVTGVAIRLQKRADPYVEPEAAKTLALALIDHFTPMENRERHRLQANSKPLS